MSMKIKDRKFVVIVSLGGGMHSIESSPVTIVKTTATQHYTVSQKATTFKLSVTLSNLNRFSKILHCSKAYEIC